ncbi:MAG: type II toxin-antitoxin system VapC family toxin [Acidobacteriota bacterium]
MRLDQIESGTPVFIDSTIFIYHFTAVSKDCRNFLERCEDGEIKGVTSTAVLAEIAHRLMMIEAVTRELASPGGVAKKLRRRPEIVRQLHLYQEQVEKIPLMAIDIMPLDLSLILQAKHSRIQYGLLTNDSLVVTSAQNRGVGALASADRDFDRLENIQLYRPADLSLPFDGP